MEKTEELDFLALLWPFTGIVFLIVLGVLLLNQQFNKKLYGQKLEKERLKARHQSELLRASIVVQEEERKRIARDLHDELGAALSMTRMHLVQLEQQAAMPEPVAAGKLQHVRSMTEQALASMRRISHELMPPQLEHFGLVQTLDATAAEINRLEQLRVDVSADASFPRLPPAVELGLCRIAMELINNTIRHAGAGRIVIRLALENDLLRFQYRDNGKGLPAGVPKKGIGLRSIETRIHAMDGTFTMDNPEDGGMQVTVEIDLAPLRGNGHNA